MIYCSDQRQCPAYQRALLSRVMRISGEGRIAHYRPRPQVEVILKVGHAISELFHDGLRPVRRNQIEHTKRRLTNLW